ncbi:MAG: hypothetical protein R2695_00380 [Acidimicrobiales bacterium]
MLCAIDGLGDRGVDAAGVLRSGRVLNPAAGRMAATARRSSKSLPRTAEALAEGAITFEPRRNLSSGLRRR